MKRLLTILGILSVILLVAFLVLRTSTKSGSPAAVVQTNQNGLTVKVDYCRPYKKGRAIFGGLVPYGQVWRTGANEATLVSFGQDVTVAGKPLKAGEYSLWTIPSQQGWIAILNGETGQWGTNYDPKKDVFRVPIVARPHSPLAEQFTISFSPASGGADMILAWDETETVIPIRK